MKKSLGFKSPMPFNLEKSSKSANVSHVRNANYVEKKDLV